MTKLRSRQWGRRRIWLVNDLIGADYSLDAFGIDVSTALEGCASSDHGQTSLHLVQFGETRHDVPPPCTSICCNWTM